MSGVQTGRAMTKLARISITQAAACGRDRRTPPLVALSEPSAPTIAGTATAFTGNAIHRTATPIAAPRPAPKKLAP
jgi:hypothetical protein